MHMDAKYGGDIRQTVSDVTFVQFLDNTIFGDVVDLVNVVCVPDLVSSVQESFLTQIALIRLLTAMVPHVLRQAGKFFIAHWTRPLVSVAPAGVFNEEPGGGEPALAHLAEVYFHVVCPVAFRMQLKVKVTAEQEATVVTFVWPFLSVCQPVCVQIGKTLAADVANVGPFATMHLPDVLAHVGPEREPLSTDLADIWLLTSVRPHVLVQVALVAKRLRADGALVRPLACVRNHVIPEVPAPTEILATDGAEYAGGSRLACVRPHVVVETRPQSEATTAHPADVRTLARVLSDVLPEVATSGETLVAGLTDVWTLAGVGSHVVLEVGISTIRSAANFADKWSLVCVHQDVSNEHRVLVKLFMAKGTVGVNQLFVCPSINWFGHTDIEFDRAGFCSVTGKFGLAVFGYVEFGNTGFGYDDFVQPFSGVHLEVVFQRWPKSESPAAHLTHIRFLAGVLTYVLAQIAALTETLAARHAHMRTLACVPSHMTEQGVLPGECAAACGADMRSFVRVCQHMLPQR